MFRHKGRFPPWEFETHGIVIDEQAYMAGVFYFSSAKSLLDWIKDHHLSVEWITGYDTETRMFMSAEEWLKRYGSAKRI